MVKLVQPTKSRKRPGARGVKRFTKNGAICGKETVREPSTGPMAQGSTEKRRAFILWKRKCEARSVKQAKKKKKKRVYVVILKMKTPFCVWAPIFFVFSVSRLK